MNDRPNQSSDPIDAEFEPADLPEEQADEKQAKAPKSGGPGWFSFFVVVLIALGSLGFSLWSSGIDPGFLASSGGSGPGVSEGSTVQP